MPQPATHLRIDSATVVNNLLPSEIGPDGEDNGGQCALVLKGEPSVILRGDAAALRELANSIHAGVNHTEAVARRAAPAVITIQMPAGHGFGDAQAVAAMSERIAEWIGAEYGVAPQGVFACQGSDAALVESGPDGAAAMP